MVKQVPGLFSKYEFREDEVALASCFSDLQLAHIRNELATACEERALLKFEPDWPEAKERFINENEFIRGKIAALNYLVEIHNLHSEEMKSAVEAMVTNATRQQQEPSGAEAIRAAFSLGDQDKPNQQDEDGEQE